MSRLSTDEHRYGPFKRLAQVRLRIGRHEYIFEDATEIAITHTTQGDLGTTKRYVLKANKKGVTINKQDPE